MWSVSSFSKQVKQHKSAFKVMMHLLNLKENKKFRQVIIQYIHCEMFQVPGSDSLDLDSPPHRKLRALRLFDTPHTPKSLLEKSRKRRPTGEHPKIAVDRPQANVNPFTPSPQPSQNDSGYCGSGKRSRSELERYDA